MQRSRHRSRSGRLAMLLIVSTLAAAAYACGDDADDATGTAAPDQTPADDSTQPASSELRQVTLATGFPERTALAIPIDVAQDIGAWERRGLDVEVVNFGEPPLLHRAIAAGEVDVVLDGGTGGLTAIDAGQDLRMVAAYMNSVAGFGVVASNDIESLDELAGKTMGLTGPLGIQDVFTQLIAEDITGDPDGINRESIGGFDALTAALARGDIDAFIWSLDGLVAVEEQDIGHQIADLSELFPHFLYAAMLTTPETIESEPELVTAMIEGLAEANQKVRNDRDYAIDRIAALTEFSPEIAASIWESIQGGLTLDGAFEDEAVTALEDALLLTGVLDERPTRDEWLDESFVPVTADGEG